MAQVPTVRIRDSKRDMLKRIQQLAAELGEIKRRLCRVLNVMGDDDLDWLINDAIAAAATPGGSTWGSDDYRNKRLAMIKRLEKKLGL